MRSENSLRISDLGVINNIANLIMCRLTGGIWLIVMVFESKIGRLIVRTLIDLILVYFTHGWWMLIVAIRAMVTPMIKDYMDDKRKQKHKKRKHRRS